MGVMEERLTLTESRVSGMIAAQRTAALQQQKSQHPSLSFVSLIGANRPLLGLVASLGAAPETTVPQPPTEMLPAEEGYSDESFPSYDEM